MVICRFCKKHQTRKSFKKLPKKLLSFVQWKVPSVTADDFFCEKCLLKLKIKYDELQEFKKTKKQLASIVGSTTEESTETLNSSLLINTFRDERTIAISPQRSKDRSITSFSDDFSLSTDISNTERSRVIVMPISSYSSNQGAQPINGLQNVTVRRPERNIQPSTSNIINPLRSEVIPIVQRDVNTVRSIVQEQRAPIIEEVEYDDSDDDSLDPGVPLPTVQPLIKRRKLVRSKGEPVKWIYTNGG